MTEEFYKQLNADLSAEFDLFALEHPDWMAENVPPGAVVVLQTDDAAFNRWARKTADENRRRDAIPRALVLVHIRELLPPQSRILRADAELVQA
jgi:hypothetical protein